MSQNFRRAIGFWFMLLLGIALLSFQFYKYFTNSLELTIEESIVTMVALTMIINPLLIIEFLRKIVNTKFNGKNG